MQEFDIWADLQGLSKSPKWPISPPELPLQTQVQNWAALAHSKALFFLSSLNKNNLRINFDKSQTVSANLLSNLSEDNIDTLSTSARLEEQEETTNKIFSITQENKENPVTNAWKTEEFQPIEDSSTNLINLFFEVITNFVGCGPLTVLILIWRMLLTFEFLKRLLFLIIHNFFNSLFEYGNTKNRKPKKQISSEVVKNFAMFGEVIINLCKSRLRFDTEQLIVKTFRCPENLSFKGNFWKRGS